VISEVSMFKNICLNVCGIKGRVKYLEFVELVKQFDVSDDGQ
jgi:hypothetical protein